MEGIKGEELYKLREERLGEKWKMDPRGRDNGVKGMW